MITPQQHIELIAADPACQGIFPYGLTDGLPQNFDGKISCVMSEFVIDLFQSVHVDEQNGEAAFRFTGGQVFFPVIFKAGFVIEPGERVFHVNLFQMGGHGLGTLFDPQAV